MSVLTKQKEDLESDFFPEGTLDVRLERLKDLALRLSQEERTSPVLIETPDGPMEGMLHASTFTQGHPFLKLQLLEEGPEICINWEMERTSVVSAGAICTRPLLQRWIPGQTGRLEINESSACYHSDEWLWVQRHGSVREQELVGAFESAFRCVNSGPRIAVSTQIEC